MIFEVSKTKTEYNSIFSNSKLIYYLVLHIQWIVLGIVLGIDENVNASYNLLQTTV